MEIETGSITIDGIDTRSLSLQSLRDSLSIIPQDPVLFAGTVKYNIDATGKSTEKEIWSALNNASPDLAHKFKSSGLGISKFLYIEGNYKITEQKIKWKIQRNK